MRMRHIIVWGLSGPTIFFHILTNVTILEKKMFIEHKMCFVNFSTRNERNTIKNVYWFSCEVFVILVRF
jgi:hypothetical protein